MERLTVPAVKLENGKTVMPIIDGRAVREHAMQFYWRLKEYEDAEENGFLLRLPVALGKPCYVIEQCKCGFRYKCRAQNSTTARVKAKVVKDWKQYGNMRYCLKIYERPFKAEYLRVYGKTVFATLEEAHKVVTELTERG